ncbi:MAG: tetratricopeptide (TPR) repeat protein [bacterium]
MPKLFIAQFAKNITFLCFFKKFLLFLLILTSTKPLFAEELVLDDDEVFNYANHLYQKNEFYRAISEYKRLQFYFPTSRHKNQAKIQLGKSYMAGGSFKEAINYWELLLKKVTPKEELFFEVNSLFGVSLLEHQKEYPFTLRKENIQKAVHHFKQTPSGFPGASAFQDFSKQWNQRKDIDEKSPFLAGSLSAIIPGAGSFYSRRYWEGTQAFFLTSLFAWATYNAIHSKQHELGVVFGFFSIAFYGGNIYTAVSSAHKYNDQQQTNYLNKLRKKHRIWFIR